MKKKLIFFVFLLIITVPALATRSPQAIVDQVTKTFLKVKDAEADLTLDIKLHLFGCAGGKRLTGHGYFMSPLLGMVTMDKEKYYAKGNDFRKIDKNGQKWYIKLLYTPDFSLGFHPGLINYNFNLKLLKDQPDEIVIEGVPKTGIMKNIEKVIFHLDPKRNLLLNFDVMLKNKRLSGKMHIDYTLIAGLWTPTRLRGTTAFEMRTGHLVGVSIDLQSQNMKINQGLASSLFDPGF